MGKKKNKSSNRGSQSQQSFEQYMHNQTLNKFRSYIDEEVRVSAQAIAQQQKGLLENLYTRTRVLEELFMEKFPELTKDVLAAKVASVEDKALGLEVVDLVEKGDRVRLEISTKAKDQDDFQGTSKIMIDNVGSGQTLGEELESATLGMKTDSVKEFEFGSDKSMIAKLIINRISRAPKKEEPPAPTPEPSEGSPLKKTDVPETLAEGIEEGAKEDNKPTSEELNENTDAEQ